MKKVFAISMSLIFLTIAVKDLAIYASFKINQDYIIEFLCINKEKEELQCNGKCHLNQNLQESKEQEQDCPLSIDHERTLQLYQQDVDILSLHSFPAAVYLANYADQNLHPSIYIHELFRPPC